MARRRCRSGAKRSMDGIFYSDFFLRFDAMWGVAECSQSLRLLDNTITKTSGVRIRIPHPRVRLTNLRNHLQYHILSNLRYKHAPKSLTSKICFCMCHRACRSQPSNKLDPTVEPSYRRVTGSAPLPKASEKLFGRLLTTVSLDNGCLWMVQIYAAGVKR